MRINVSFLFFSCARFPSRCNREEVYGRAMLLILEATRDFSAVAIDGAACAERSAMEEPVAARHISWHLHAPASHAFQRARAGFMAAALDGAECSCGRAKGESRSSTLLSRNMFQQWQHITSLY